MRIQRLLIPALLCLFVFLVYLHNLSRSVYGGDVGDLLTAAFVGGVAHPPGYPLFTLLGFFLTRFHFWPTPAFGVGIISAASGAVGVVVFYLIAKELTKKKLISFLSSLILAFSYFFWFYSEIAEVFALNNLFFLLLLYVTLKIRKEKSLRFFPLFTLLLGLSLTNHQTIVFTFPTFFLLLLPVLFKDFQKKRILFKTLGVSLGTFLLGFAVYLYVPFASSHNPLLNWDNVRDISSFLHLFLRQDYGTLSAGLFLQPNFLQRLILIKTYLIQLVVQLTIPVIVIAFLGIVSIIRKQTQFVVAMLFGFFLSGPVFVGYAGFPLTGNFYFGVNERFFILSTLFILSFFPFGMVWISNIFKKFSHVSPAILQGVFFIIPLMLFMYNFPKTNLSHVFVGDTYAKDFLQPLPKHAIVFLSGDTIIFNVWYAHYVLGIRPDVQILNINGNIGSPYFTSLEKKYAATHPHSSQQQRIKGIMENLPRNGTVFSIEALDVGKDAQWIPYGLLLQLIDKDTTPTERMYTQEINNAWSSLHIPSENISLAAKNPTIVDIPNSYANAMLLTGNFYLSAYEDGMKAKSWYLKSARVAPNYEKTYSSLGVYYLTIDKKCTVAKDNFTKAIALNPIEPVNYYLLYATYNGCLHDAASAKRTQQIFEKRFQTTFPKSFSKVKENTK